MIKLKNIVNEDGVLGSKKPIGLSKIDPKVADAAIGGGHLDANKTDDVIDGKKAFIAVSKLKPAQKEIIKQKALSIAINLLLQGKWDNLDLGSIISNDSYIMDGHHRWAAISLIDPNAKIEGTVIDLPGGSLVTALNLITVGKLGITHGNKGMGDVATFTGTNFQPLIDDAIKNGLNKFSAEEVKTALGKVPGANGDYNKGKSIIMQNANKLPKQIMPDAPSRIEMPVINADKVNMVKTMLQKGAVDVEMPYSAKVKTNIKQESKMIKLTDLLKEEEAPKCPVATQNGEVNIKHRQIAIDRYGYGPLNPNNPNIKFWKKKAEMWKIVDIDEVKSARCNSCAAFNITSRMISCIEQGLNMTPESPAMPAPTFNEGEEPIPTAPAPEQEFDDTEGAQMDQWDTIEAGKLGYCTMHKFKCAGSRTCNAWIEGGPVKDK